MNIFNSLGSNYDASFVWRSIFQPGDKKTTAELREALANHYGGQVTFTYKGRQALELIFKNADLPVGSSVGINGFTCYVVYQAIERAGYRPVFIDVAKHDLHFGENELKKAYSKDKDIKAIVVQNSLGLPADMPKLESFCKKNGIMIIEDLAHSLGAHYSDGREAGMIGDFTMLSFSQDKPLDVVAGGALVDRRAKAEPVAEPQKRVSLWQREINSMYPFWTSVIRGTYALKLGRYIHFSLKKLHLLATPMSDNLAGIYVLEPSAAKLLLKRWKNVTKELEHRREVAKVYELELPQSIQFKVLPKSDPTYLRFPIWVKDRPGLITQLKSKGIYIGDTWYDAPIAPARYLRQTRYAKGDCPNAEGLAEHIVNLPTHQHVGVVQARFIAEEVKKCLTLK